MFNSSKILPVMIDAAKSSAQIIRDNFRQSEEFANKTSHIDIVTKTDLDSQKNIRDLLTTAMLEMGFTKDSFGFIEEESTEDFVKKYNFIVDPIDGTTNFASGIPFSCISIGFSVDSEVILGVVYEPFSNTLYWGEKGKGSFIENSLVGKKRLKLESKSMNSWMVATHFNAIDVVESQFETYKKLYPEVRGLRNIGSLTLDLCFMADNVFDVIYNKGCYLWDLAAASVILSEAGGQIFDYNGSPIQFDWNETKKKYNVIATKFENINKAKSFI